MRRLLLALALMITMPRLAEAHATLVRAVPATGGRLTAWPGRIELVFSEELEAGLAKVTLVGADGKTIPVSVQGDPRNVNALVGTLGTLANGSYRLRWHIVSADGHPVDGSYEFVLEAPVTDSATSAAVHAPPVVTPVPVSPPAPKPSRAIDDIPYLAATLRGLALMYLMGLAGVLGYRVSSTRQQSVLSGRRSARALTMLAVGAAAFSIAHLAAWAMHISPTHSLDAATMIAAAGSSAGKLELWRAGLALLALWAWSLARRPAMALVITVCALLVSGATGHSAALSPLWAIPAKTLHLLAGAAWLGGLMWLLTFVNGDSAIISESTRVSSAALTAVLLVLVSGLVQTFLFLPQPLDVIRTSYGAFVIAKVLGLLALVAFGAKHRFRTLPRLEDDLASAPAFHRSLRHEVTVMTFVILLGGALAYIPPNQP